MNVKDCKVIVIGAGVSGLVAAKTLEEKGFCPIILEASDSIGGRVKTDLIDGFRLDHGFQVLLTAYPEARKHLNYQKLQLQEFLPGAVIYKDQKRIKIGDPLRERSFLWSTLFSSIGNLSDKLKILKLNKYLKKKSIDDIFTTKERTTLEYLKEFGFSDGMIDYFFTPFFTGIFLESGLNTSSRMFEFVYKMFGEGNAAIPREGIGAIPEQIFKGLNSTTLHLNTKVKTVRDGEIELINGEVLKNDYTIITANASSLVSNLRGESLNWKSCQTLYFKTPARKIKEPLIGLIPSNKTLINNIFYHTSLDNKMPLKEELLSVTLVNSASSLTDELLIKQVQMELSRYCSIDQTTFLKMYQIPQALPNLSNLQNEIPPSETRLTSNIFLAGDVQLNGSLNAAMLSGELAAEAIHETITQFSF